MCQLRPVTPLSILAKKLDSLLTNYEQGNCGEQFRKDLEISRDLAAGLDPYVEMLSTPEDPSLKRLSVATKNFDWSDSDDPELVKGLEAEMLSGHVEGQFLRMLVEVSGAKNILEVGVFSGYSAVAMAKGLPEDGKIVACELDARAGRFAKEQFLDNGLDSKVDLRIGPAVDTLRELAETDMTFDLMFVDADKQNYENYVKLALDENLISIGGIFIIDNTLLQGEVYLEAGEKSAPGQAIASFNKYLASEHRVEQVIIPLRDGVTFAKRKI
mgnify:CR=1 FL=1